MKPMIFFNSEKEFNFKAFSRLILIRIYIEVLLIDWFKFK